MSDRTRLTVDEAIAVIDEGELVRTLCVYEGLVFQTFLFKSDIAADIRANGGAEIVKGKANGGDEIVKGNVRRKGYELCVVRSRPTFVATDPGRLAALEAKIAAEGGQ